MYNQYDSPAEFDDVVEEGAEGGAGQFGGRIRHLLNDALQVELGGNDLTDTG